MVDKGDIMIIVGLGSCGYGLWVYEPWVSMSVIGAVLLGFGVIFKRTVNGK